MFARTTEESPWNVVEADDKRTARLNLISHLLSLVPYERLGKAQKGRLPRASGASTSAHRSRPEREVPDALHRHLSSMLPRDAAHRSSPCSSATLAGKSAEIRLSAVPRSGHTGCRIGVERVERLALKQRLGEALELVAVLASAAG